jgi:hypothetical protein
MMEKTDIYSVWWKENEEKIHQSHTDLEAVSYISFVAGAKAMETFMENNFDSSNNKKNFVKKHFWDLL